MRYLHVTFWHLIFCTHACDKLQPHRQSKIWSMTFHFIIISYGIKLFNILNISMKRWKIIMDTAERHFHSNPSFSTIWLFRPQQIPLSAANPGEIYFPCKIMNCLLLSGPWELSGSQCECELQLSTQVLWALFRIWRATKKKRIMKNINVNNNTI